MKILLSLKIFSHIYYLNNISIVVFYKKSSTPFYFCIPCENITPYNFYTNRINLTNVEVLLGIDIITSAT